MDQMYYSLENHKRDIDVKQYVYYIGSYHYNWHDAMELLIVLQGEIEVSHNGRNDILAEDDLMIINSNVGHATLARKPNSIAMVIHLHPIYFSSYFSDYQLLQFKCISIGEHHNKEPFKKIRRLAVEMIQYMGGNTPTEKLWCESLLHELTANLVKYFPPEEISSTEMASNKRKNDAVNEIIHYIDKNYKNKISLEELSNVFGYNKSYISQIVKLNLGINFYEYLTRIRLREATYALANLEEKISDIALSYGFSEVKSFNTAFRNSFGKTPSEYRKQLSIKKDSQSLVNEKRYLTEGEFRELIKVQEEFKPSSDFLLQDNKEQEEKKLLNKEDYQTISEIRKELDSTLKKVRKIEKKLF
ncbi:AraC family transcriptional regulator [Bacillus sp. UMB0899]|uniref:helix-turn-helix domain-containing protein n=1 Tax=Metabacillus schmidteae TaxID=2730405 RepID=UPI000C803AC2|nr:AraC family transcriptional regulator [Metabacillus schmidteae]PMC34749.1 AraC family transcriptional regulator [Bacillus sp. UMB0899]